MKKWNYMLMAVGMTLITACSQQQKDYDATGVFEATEIMVSAEQNGKLVKWDIDEGKKVEAGWEVGIIDTVQLYLQAKQIGATKLGYKVQQPEIKKQMAATQQQLAKAEQDKERYEALVKCGAANQKLLDDANSQVLVLKQQLTALQSTLTKSSESLGVQMSGADIQRMMVADKLNKCHIKAPTSGVVLNKYAELGEFASVGKPLFKMADMEHLFLRAYITCAQLQNVRLGSKVKVYADYGKSERKEYDGMVCWISDKAEFTPKTILTDDERADMVYAIKVALKNDGYLKIGMYGEVKF